MTPAVFGNSEILMKAIMYASRILPALTVAITMAVNLCSGQVAVTVSPSAVGNDYQGFITLNITGLTNQESVKVQTYLDLNSNGVVTANDPLIDAFNLTDGGAFVIGGITNISVPYDTNPATGAITATLSFALPLDNFVGQRIYRVASNPSGAFSPVTAVLNVTNSALGQSVSGIVYSNGITPLPGAVVVALTATNQNIVSGAIADASGHYLLDLYPGTYLLVPTLPGYFVNQMLAPQVTLTNGELATNNLVVTNGTVTIEGTIYDQVSSNALGGVFVQATASGGLPLFEVTFTDTNGNYTLGATSNNWKIKLTDERLSRRGYLTPQGNALTVNASFGAVSNANIGLYRGNALFYGQLTIGGAPVTNAAIECNDNDQLLNSKAYTLMNGDYGVVALVNTNVLPAGTSWNVAPNVNDETGSRLTSLVNYIYSVNENALLPNTNISYLQNFVGLPITGTISGHLVNNLGVPVPGVGVGGGASVSGNQLVTSFPDTDANGAFSFGVANGSWNVQPNCCGSDGLDDFGYYVPSNYVVNVPPDNSTITIVVYPADVPLLAQPGAVSRSQFNFNLYGASGYNYTVQTTTNLNKSWSTLTVVTNLPNSPYLIEDFQATNSMRFYRAFESQ